MSILLDGLNSTNTSSAATLAALANPATAAGVQKVQTGDPNGFIVCYSPSMITTNGLWQGDNPLDFSLPLFILQAILVVVVTRSLNVLLRRVRQPRFVAEVIGGVVLGPSVLGKIPSYMDVVFPTRSLAVLETMANLGLVYFIFLVGLQVDLSSVNRVGRKVWVITGAGVVLPFVVETLAYVLFGSDIKSKSYVDSYLIFVGVSLSITAYPVLTRILAELKLLNTETGKLAMSAAILNDGIAWVLLTVAIALCGKHRSIGGSVGIVLSGVAFVVLVYYTVRPAADWIMSQPQEGQILADMYVVPILLAVMVCGILADAVGIHAVFGAFTMGVVIPNGPLVAVLIEKLEDFVTGFLLPLFFAVVGIKVDVRSMDSPGVFMFLIAVILVAGAGRVGATLLVSMSYGMPIREGLSLGVLMNTKGIMELIVLHIALDKQVLYTQSYTTMILMSVVMTALVTPLAMLVYRPSRHLVSYKRRMIQRAKPDAELRMLACVHSTRNVPSIVTLLELSHPTKRSPIFVYAAHLVELTGRESAMLIVHDTQQHNPKRRRCDSSSSAGSTSGSVTAGNLSRVQAQSEQIIKAFETYEQHAGGVSIQTVSVVSAYSTMHEDVRNLAEDRHAALLLLPFHKQHTVDGSMEAINPGIRTLNQNVLADAPCSVAILIDRGLGGASRIASSSGRHTHNVAVLFIGGPDDREALAYAARMADHPAVNLTVLRFVDASEVGSPKSSIPPPQDARVLNVMTETEREKALDDECVKEFRIKTMSYESVAYTEKVVGNGEETVAAIRGLDGNHDLFISGRGGGMGSPLTAGLTDWTETAELGAIGDMLASSDFTSTVSVLVVQQYKGAAGTVMDGPVAPYSPVAGGNPVQQYLNKANTRDKAVGWGP